MEVFLIVELNDTTIRAARQGRAVAVDLSSRDSIEASVAALPAVDVLVNNASISGYASFPAASTYAAAKAGVVALSESLRRELKPAGIEVMHLVTPGVDTDMLDDTRAVYGSHMRTGDWPSVSAQEWADKVVEAMKRGDHIVGPGGRLALAKLASRGPAFVLDASSGRMFTR